MEQSELQHAETMQKFFEYNEEVWKKVQELYFGENPISKAIAKVNTSDLAEFYSVLSSNPMRLIEIQMKWWQGQMEIYKNVLARAVDKETKPLIEDFPGDRRFASDLWKDEPNYDLIRQSYLHFAKSMQEMLDVVEGIPNDAKDRLAFFFRQMINAFSPTNFIWTNPEILKQTIDEQGENLARGAKLFHDDLLASSSFLKIRMMQDNAFEVGKDLAYTPGQVVFRNDIFELIQYDASTKEVFKTPLFIVPPFINKYYILDLREKNSFVRWLCDQGHTVFLMSWKNPGRKDSNMTFDDLAIKGVLEGMKVAEEITGEKEFNTLGYCMGGTLLAVTQAYAVGKKLKSKFKTATYMTTLLDYQYPGELGVFINEPVISAIEAQDEALGYLDGRQLAVAFSLLRENTLYWNYYIENYLKGKEPGDFDILYWNSDGTNVTPPIHSFILRNLYMNNELSVANKVKIDNVGIDLSKVKTPNFFISTKEDHIALWQGTFKGSTYLGGESTLVLGDSGHVAGIVNHPSRDKYGYSLNEAKYVDDEQWLSKAKHHKGSWWVYWQEWITPYAGEKIPARKIGNAKYKAITAAPGDYVKQTLPLIED